MSSHASGKLAVQFLMITSLALSLGCQKRSDTETEAVKQIPVTADTQSTLNGTITGASMAPMLMGEHQASKCSECGFEMRFEIMRSISKFICSNCGQENRLTDREVKTILGDQRLFGKRPANQALQHWDVIAFKSTTGNESDHKVKRIVGLPGETIELQSGDLWVDGERTVKPEHVFEKMRVLVHDSNSASKANPRWMQNQQQAHFPVKLSHDNTSLRYQHLGCYRKRDQRREELIKDSYGFNQTLSRSLNTVSDFGVEMTLSDIADLQIELQMRTEKYGLVRFDFQQNSDHSSWDRYCVWQSLKEGGNKKSFAGPHSKLPGSGVLQFWLRDGEARLIVNGAVFGECKLYEKSPAPPQPPAKNQVADARFEVRPSNQIVLSKLTANHGEIKRIRVFRDLYYYDRQPGRKHVIGKDEYFVLGDNVPVSNDSRHFGGIKRDSVIAVLQNKE